MVRGQWAELPQPAEQQVGCTESCCIALLLLDKHTGEILKSRSLSV